MSNNKAAEEITIEYGFRWFEFHARQRTTTFYFYLGVYAGLAAAEGFLLKEKIHVGSVSASLVMIIMSLLFWQLDVRNRQLIEIGESLLSQGWKKSVGDESINPVSLAAKRHLSSFRYKELFGAVFTVGVIGGIAAFSYAVYLAQA